MAYRKGELTDTTIDRDWPYQVALAADYVCAHFDAVARSRGELSTAPRTRRVTVADIGRSVEEFVVYRFTVPADAERFAARFGGVPFDPKRDRGRGKRRGHWVNFRL